MTLIDTIIIHPLKVKVNNFFDTFFHFSIEILQYNCIILLGGEKKNETN